MNEREFFAAMMFMFISIIIIAIVGGPMVEKSRTEAFLRDNTCDEMYVMMADYERSSLQTAIYKKCMQDIFPSSQENYYPSSVDIHAYLLKLDCNDLGIHALKRHFSYETAHEMYTIKCSTPLDQLVMPEVTLDRTTQTKQDPDARWIKSDETNYGKQYNDWKK